MRNILKRSPSTETRPTLRERFAATKAKAGKALRRSKASPESAPDRTALVCYSTWLGLERRRVCEELYPHLGNRGTAFSLGYNAGEAWHFKGPNRTGGDADRGPVSARAVRMLDLLGVDWRGDKAKGRGPDDIAGDRAKDTGDRPPKPYGWPADDAALVTAAGDLLRLDGAIEALVAGDERNVEEIPGTSALNEARDEALSVLEAEIAEGLPGLQAKAKALLSDSMAGEISEPYLGIAESLARDLLRANGNILVPQADPIFAVIEECRRLEAAHAAIHDVCAGKSDNDPAWAGQSEAHAAYWTQWRDVVLTTVPRTGRGCRALAAYAAPFFERQGSDAADAEAILALIARSPML